MHRRILHSILSLFLLSLTSLLTGATHTLYVSADAPAGGSGTRTRPLRSLHDAVQIMKKKPKRDIKTIYAARGRYTPGNGIKRTYYPLLIHEIENITLSGGWDRGFRRQSGYTTLAAAGFEKAENLLDITDSANFKISKFRLTGLLQPYGPGHRWGDTRTAFNISRSAKGTVVDCIIQGNKGGDGAAIRLDRSQNIKLTASVSRNTAIRGQRSVIRMERVNNSEFHLKVTDNRGTGLTLLTSWHVKLTGTFRNNRNPGRDGGAIHTDDSRWLTLKLTANGNSAGRGGAVFMRGGRNNTIQGVLRNNRASGHLGSGGAVHLEGYTYGSEVRRITTGHHLSITATGNRASLGGALYACEIYRSSIRLRATGNKASTRGGGLILNRSGKNRLWLRLKGNRAAECGGAYIGRRGNKLLKGSRISGNYARRYRNLRKIKPAGTLTTIIHRIGDHLSPYGILFADSYSTDEDYSRYLRFEQRLYSRLARFDPAWLSKWGLKRIEAVPGASELYSGAKYRATGTLYVPIQNRTFFGSFDRYLGQTLAPRGEFWRLLNPPGFQYGKGTRGRSSGPGFLSKAGRLSLKRDFGDVFAAALGNSPGTGRILKDDRYLKKKARYTMALLEYLAPEFKRSHADKSDRRNAKNRKQMKKAVTAAPTFAGPWESSFGRLVLKQNGTRISGTYTYNKGHLQGTLRGRRLTFRWHEKKTGEKGIGYFVIRRNGKGFYGKWGYKSYWDGGNWSGYRKRKNRKSKKKRR